MQSPQTTPCGYGSPRARGRRVVSGVAANCFNRHCCDKRKAFAHASAAKQSIVRLSKKLDCFAALAMTTSMGIRLRVTHTSASSRRECVRVVREFSAFPMERRGECRVPTHPQPRMQSKKAYELVTTGKPDDPAFPHAMVLTVSFVISPVIGLCCHRRFARLSAKLDASVEASGPHDFAVRVQHRSSAAPPTSIASRPASVTIASAPLVGRDGAIRKVICGKNKPNYFSDWDSTAVLPVRHRPP